MTESRAGSPRVRRRQPPAVAVMARGQAGGPCGAGGSVKAPDGATTVRARVCGRLFALRRTEQIRHGDDADDSGRADCHANRATERRPVIVQRLAYSEGNYTELRAGN